MDTAIRQQYNKDYYSKNKSTICAKLAEKEACSICGRMVNHQNIPRHLKTKKCMAKAEQQIDKENSIENIKEEMTEIRNVLDKIKALKQLEGEDEDEYYKQLKYFLSGIV
jgi:hypothetical protein